MISFVAAVAIISVAACRSSQPAPGVPSPVPVRESVPPVVEPAPVRPAGVPFRFSPARNRYRYSVLSEVIAVGSRGDTARDSVASYLTISTQIQDSGTSIFVSGTIDSLTTYSQRRRMSPQLAVTRVPFTSAINRSSSARMIPADSMGVCTATGVARDMVIATLWRLPATIVPGDVWTDSVTRVSCTGTIPSRIRAAARYQLLERVDTIANVPIHHIARTTITELEGRSAVGDSTIITTGTFTSHDTLDVELQRGRIVQTSGTTDGTISLRSLGQVEQFRQRSRQQLVTISMRSP